MTTTGAMSGVVDYQQQLDTSGAAVETEFRVTVWNESPGSTIDVMVDGVTVGSITINTWGYGTLSFHSDHATNTFPANWPGVSNGSVVTAGSGLTATFDPTMQVATPGHHELESAYELDHRLGLHIENNLYENWGDEGEKWLKGSDRNWYYITNDGSLYEWDGTNHASGTLVQQLDPAVYDDPELLYDAQPVQAAATDSNLLRWTAANLDHDLGLTEAASDHENWGGEGERWFKDSAGDWYFITPSGQVFSWDGSNHASGTLVAELDSTYHSDLSLLTRAESTLTTEETAYAADQGLGLRSLNDDFLNWGGEHEKWVMDASGEW
ncbi:MAG: hypothetical protein KDA96_23350, partial [Planctomycetaceae bacterium]|nr:hypothetical protein [Planctomycetaceae bacterium]